MIRTDRSKFARSRNGAVLSFALVGAMLLTAAQSHAITITQTNPGGTYAVSDSVAFTYALNNMGDPGLAVIAFSVGFDTPGLSYDEGTTTSKIKNKILKATEDEGGNTPNIYGGMPRLSTVPLVQGVGDEILFSWSSAPVAAWVEVSNRDLGTAVFVASGSGFHVVGPFVGQGASVAQDAGSYANAGVSFNDITNELIFRGRGGVWVPEPGVASLSLAAIATLYAIRRRQTGN